MSSRSDAARRAWFRSQKEALRSFALAEPGNPYRQSGRSSGAARWAETRRPLAEAVHHDGAYLDVGCANGLLLETMIAWCASRGLAIRPHGVDFIPELVDLARRRHPGHEASFHVANAWDWDPHRRYDFVRTSIEYVPGCDREVFVRRQLAWVAPGGRLIVCHYRNADEPEVDVGALLEEWGICVVGRRRHPVECAWADVS